MLSERRIIMEHWSDTIEAPPEVKAAMAESKYNSHADWQTGAINAMKTVGSPFRLPKSLDSLPDDDVRKDFHSQLGKLLGRDVSAASAEELAAVNFADGLADASNVNEDLKAAYIKMATDEGLSKALAQKLVSFNNTFVTQAKNAMAEAEITAASEVSDKIKGLYGGDAGVERHRDLVSALVLAHGGLTEEERAKFAGEVQSLTKKSVEANKALFNIAKKIMPESTTTKPGDPAGEIKKETLAQRQDKALPHTSQYLWPKH
jgi:hypothetical protein